MTVERSRPWSLVTLGTGGDGTRKSLGYPALLLAIGTHRTLLDVGEGTLRQLATLNAFKPFDRIVLTALTTERVAGLASLLDHLTLRRSSVSVVGPAGTRTIIDALRTFMSDDVQVDEVVEVSDHTNLDGEGWTLTVSVVDDGPSGAVLGVRLTEPEVSGRFDVATAQQLGLRPGPAFARLQLGQTVDGVRPEDVIGPPRPGRRLCILGPCRPTAAAVAQAADARLLVAVAPHIEEHHQVAAEAGTMTGVEAATLAHRAKAEVLALVHVGASVNMGYALKEARQFHHRTILARDGDLFGIPLAHNGPVDHKHGGAT